MSVSKMKKLTVLAHRDKLDELVKKLVRLRCVEVSDSVTDPCEEGLLLNGLDCEQRRLELESSLSDISRAISILDPYVKRSKGIFAQKMKVNTDAFVSKGHEARARNTVKAALEAEAGISAARSEMLKHEANIVAATPYINYDMPLGFTGTESSEVLLGVLPAATDLDLCGRELYEAGAVAEILHKDKNGIYTVFFCHKTDSAVVLSVLASYGFLRAGFAGVKATATDSIKESRRQLKLLAAEEDRLRARLSELAISVDALEVLYDMEATELVSVEQMLKMTATESVAIIKGWIPVRREGAVSAYLDSFECAYEICEPAEDEVPPILLQNNGFASNFEWVLGMYSYPLYGKFDPTFIMSIFYFIIFGIMFADAGYGLVLLLACFGAVKFLKPGEGMTRFLKMFGYCGISCIIFGVLFGAYFGDLPLAIMRNMMGIPEDQLPNLALMGATGANVALLFDPLQNPMGFLIFSLAVGAVHLIAGMAVQFCVLCKDGHVLDAIFDIGAYWLLFAGIGLLFVIPSVALWITIGAVALIVLTHGRAEKNPVMKLLKGLLGLYDLINYVADLLSYSRILALGLAAGIIGQVVNILATMGGPTVVGFIVLVVAFIIGHLLNLAINVLGTFVHTSRLQYIEFFGKFYEDGGRPFEPAVPSEKFSQQTNE